MKSYLIYIAFILLFMPFMAKSQSETIIDRGQFTRSHAAEIFGDKIVLSNNIPKPNIFRGLTPTKLMLSILDKDLNIIDSINFSQKGADILEIESIGDTILAVGMRIWPVDSPKGKNKVLFYDTNFNLLSTYFTRPPNAEALTLIDIEPFGDTLILSYVEFPLYLLRIPETKPFLEIVSLKSRKKISTVTYHDSLLNTGRGRQANTSFTKMMRFKNGFLAMDREVGGGNNVIIYKLNAQFELESYVKWSDPSLVQLLPVPISLPPALDLGGDKFIKNKKGEVFLTGQVGQRHIGLLKLDTNLQGKRLDTFDMVRYKYDDSYNGYSRHLYPEEFKNNTDFITPDSIFFAVSMYRFNHFFISPRAEYEHTHQDIIVYNMDTSGNLNWRKRIAQDSVFFLAESIFATKDGGAVVFAGKMDLKKDMQPHEMVSIIKLDRFGNVINEREFKAPEPAWSVYPNPLSTNFTLEGLPENEPLQLQLLNINGQIVWQQEGKTRQWQLPSTIEKGVYLLKLTNAQGQPIGMRKVVVQGE